MFQSNSKLSSLDIGGWNTSNVTNMSWMFAQLYNVTTLDLNDWETGNVTDISYMFNESGVEEMY